MKCQVRMFGNGLHIQIPGPKGNRPYGHAAFVETDPLPETDHPLASLNGNGMYPYTPAEISMSWGEITLTIGNWSHKILSESLRHYLKGVYSGVITHSEPLESDDKEENIVLVAFNPAHEDATLEAEVPDEEADNVAAKENVSTVLTLTGTLLAQFRNRDGELHVQCRNASGEGYFSWDQHANKSTLEYASCTASEKSLYGSDTKYALCVVEIHDGVLGMAFGGGQWQSIPDQYAGTVLAQLKEASNAK